MKDKSPSIQEWKDLYDVAMEFKKRGISQKKRDF